MLRIRIIMKMLSIIKLLSVCVCSLSLLHGSRGQNCLQADGNSGNLPFLERLFGAPRITHRNQAIVASYQFSCCGNVTEWGAGVETSGGKDDGRYTISFQVWRPSPTVQTDGCYSLVGQNRFTSVTLTNRLIMETPAPEQRIPFRPNDVVGFFIESASDIDNGVTLNEDYNSEEVWYGSIDDVVAGPQNCPFPVGTQAFKALRTSASAAPLISVSFSTGSCPPFILPTTSSQPPQNPTMIIQSTTDTLLPSPTPPPSTPLTPPPSTLSPMTVNTPFLDTTETPSNDTSPLTPSQPSPSTPSQPTTDNNNDRTTPETNDSSSLVGVVSGSIAAGVAIAIVVIATIVCVGAVKSRHIHTETVQSKDIELDDNRAYGMSNKMASISTERNEAYGKTTNHCVELTMYSSVTTKGGAEDMNIHEYEVPTLGNTAYATTTSASTVVANPHTSRLSANESTVTGSDKHTRQTVAKPKVAATFEARNTTVPEGNHEDLYVNEPNTDTLELTDNTAYGTNDKKAPISTQRNEAYGTTTHGTAAQEDPTDTLYSSPEDTGYMYTNEPEIPTVGNTAYGTTNTTTAITSSGRGGVTATNTQTLIESEGGRGGSHDNGRHRNGEDEYDYVTPQ